MVRANVMAREIRETAKTNTKSGIVAKKKQKERTRVEYPEEGRKALAALIEEEIEKVRRQLFRQGEQLMREAEQYKKTDNTRYNQLRNQGKELINESFEFTPAAFQRYMEDFVFPDGNKYPITHNQFYLLLRGSEQGYSMAVLIRLAFHLTKDEERTISYSYEELVAIASCNTSRQYFDYSENRMITPDSEENGISH